MTYVFDHLCVQIIHRCAGLLSADVKHFHNIIRIPFARVPIVKGGVTLLPSDVKVEFDICVNNRLALHNTDLLRTYAQLDTR